jgi:hypothetical protein
MDQKNLHQNLKNSLMNIKEFLKYKQLIAKKKLLFVKKNKLKLFLYLELFLHNLFLQLTMKDNQMSKKY